MEPNQPEKKTSMSNAATRIKKSKAFHAKQDEVYEITADDRYFPDYSDLDALQAELSHEVFRDYCE